MKIVRAKDIPTNKNVFLEKDWADNCANYARKMDDGRIRFETLYRFGKPKVIVMSASEFNSFRKTIEKSSMTEA